MPEDSLEILRNALRQTQSPDADTRKKAEQFLKDMQRHPGYPQMLIRLIELHSSTDAPEDKSIRTLGAILFKNLVKQSWAPAEDSEFKDTALSATDKEAIKGNMVHIMCVVPSEVQRQFSEALVIISKHDFPQNWPALLPDLTSRMASSDFGSLYSVLITANSILKRFRFEFKSNALFEELAYVLKTVQEPLTQLLQKLNLAVKSSAGNPQQLAVIFECLRLVARIFYSLNWQDIPEFFEDNIALWMGEFSQYLTYNGPKPSEPRLDDEPNALEKLQAAIVENVNLYASKYDEEFQPHLANFTSIIWALLLKVSQEQKHDILTTTCIRFLTSIVSKQIHSSLFSEETTLRQIVENIVVPNMKLRELEEELFTDNPSDYIQRDMEGSDSDTRRRVSCDLIRGMCKHHEAITTRICSEYIHSLLAQYNQNPDGNWQSKDAALQLLLAVSVRAISATHGVSETNKYLDIMEIFSSSIVPEISDPNVNARPIVKADCVKFIAVFRNQFTIDQMRALVPLLVAHLRSEHVVVATYAAMAVEKIQLVKDKTPPELGATGIRAVQRFGKSELEPFLHDLFTGLFGVLDNADMPDNEYVMKAIMRSLNTAQEKIVPVAQIVLGKAVRYLARICSNPANPHFNHYLFESIAILVSKVCQTDAKSIDLFESNLFPPFQQVLVQDVIEFAPYVFQILAQLLELRPITGGPGGVFTPAYVALFPPLLSPMLWERRGNVPALVRLLQAYLQKDATTLVNENRLPALLGIFQKLLATRATEEYAFSFLGTIFITMTPQQLDPYLKDIFNLLLLRLQNNKNAKYIRFLTHFFSVLACKYDAKFLMDCLERVQAGLFIMILSQIWIPLFDEHLVLSEKEKRIFSIGMSKIACDPTVQVNTQADLAIFGKLLHAIIVVLAPDELQKQTVTVDFVESEEEEIAFDSTYSKLHYASTGMVVDPAKDVVDAKLFFVRSLCQLCALSPGRYPVVLSQGLTPHQLHALQGFCAEAGVTLT